MLLEALKVQEQTYARCSETKGDLFPLPLPSTLETSSFPIDLCRCIGASVEFVVRDQDYQEDTERIALD